MVPGFRAVLHSCLRTDRQLTFEFCTGIDEVSYLSLLLVLPNFQGKLHISYRNDLAGNVFDLRRLSFPWVLSIQRCGPHCEGEADEEPRGKRTRSSESQARNSSIPLHDFDWAFI